MSWCEVERVVRLAGEYIACCTNLRACCGWCNGLCLVAVHVKYVFVSRMELVTEMLAPGFMQPLVDSWAHYQPHTHGQHIGNGRWLQPGSIAHVWLELCIRVYSRFQIWVGSLLLFLLWPTDPELWCPAAFQLLCWDFRISIGIGSTYVLRKSRTRPVQQSILWLAVAPKNCYHALSTTVAMYVLLDFPHNTTNHKFSESRNTTSADAPLSKRIMTKQWRVSLVHIVH